MTFMYEQIDAARRQEIVDLTRPPIILSMGHFQVIDRERDIVFVNLGGQGSQPRGRGAPPTFYAMLWQGQSILFEGYDEIEESGGCYHIKLTISGMTCPATLRASIDTIRMAISDAQQCYRNESSTWQKTFRVTVVIEVVNYI